jgi:hypothetical protein
MNAATMGAVDKAGARLLLGQPARTYSEYRHQLKVAEAFGLGRPARPSFANPPARLVRVFSPASKDWIRDGAARIAMA